MPVATAAVEVARLRSSFLPNLPTRGHPVLAPAWETRYPPLRFMLDGKESSKATSASRVQKPIYKRVFLKKGENEESIPPDRGHPRPKRPINHPVLPRIRKHPTLGTSLRTGRSAVRAPPFRSHPEPSPQAPPKSQSPNRACGNARRFAILHLQQQIEE